MAIPSSVIQEINERTDIADLVSRYVNLKRSGTDFVGLCPFHSEKTPSFRVTPGKRMYYCFGCQKGGGPIHFLMQVENLNFVDAVKKLGSECGVDVPEDNARADKDEQKRKQMYAANREAARFFYTCLTEPRGEEARKYFKQRNLSAEMITKFGIGYAPDSWDALKKHLLAKGFAENLLVEVGLISRTEKGSTYDRFRNRVMFPILDVVGNVIGFGSRVLDDSKPKYLNTADTPIFDKSGNLYALNFAKNDKSGQVIVVEGYMDVVTLYQYGIERAVASLGTALTARHARLLKRYAGEVVLCYDGDGAGIKAAHKAVGLMREADVKAKVITLDGAKDPDEYCKKFGVDKFLNCIEDAKPPVLYKINALKANYDVQIPEQKAEFLKAAADEIALLKEPIEREIYTREVALAASVSEEALAAQVKKAVLRQKQNTKREETTQIQRITRQHAIEPSKVLESAEGRLIALALRYKDAFAEVMQAGGAELFSAEAFKYCMAQMVALKEAGMPIPEEANFIAEFPLEYSGKVAGAVQALGVEESPVQAVKQIISKLQILKRQEMLKQLASSGDVEGVTNALHKED